MLSPTLNEVKVKFIDKVGKKKIYKAKEVQAYSFVVLTSKNKKHSAETITYVRKKVKHTPVPFGPKNVLVERPVEGELNLYNYYVETRTRNYPFEHFFYVEKDNELIKVDRSNFKKAVKRIVADYPELKAKIGKKGYGYKHMTKIIAEYNETKPKSGEIMEMD